MAASLLETDVVAHPDVTQSHTLLFGHDLFRKPLHTFRDHARSQRSAVPGLCCSDAQVRPSPCFPPLSIGEGWSAGRRPGSLAIGSLRPALRSAGLHAELPGPKFWRGWGSRDARASCEEARAPLGAPSRTALSAAAPCAVVGVAIDDALDPARRPDPRPSRRNRKIEHPCLQG